MMHVYGFLLSGFLLLFTSIPGFAASEISCECPKLGCDPCSVQKSIKFYTDKCGPENSRVKSCARPTCVPIDEATAACPNPPAANSGPRPPVVVKSAPAAAEADENAPAASKSIGKVKVIQGSVSIVHKDGQKDVVTKESELQEGETVESGADGAALVRFEGGNKLHVHPDTAVKVQEFKDPKVESSRKALLQLIKGKIRNQVEQKYNGKTTYYRVQTKAAVAGVRGTDFVMQHMPGSSLETVVETLRGRVTLSDLDETQSREIGRGEGASFKADERDIKHGLLSPVYKIEDEKLRNLDRDSRVDVAANRRKKPAPPADVAICKEPAGRFNQCSWSCTGNPKGETKCRVDLPKVSCVRHRCNGNGEWAEETRLPEAGAAMACPATGHLVKDCDY